MEIFIAVYVLTVVVAFVLGAYDYKQSFGWVDVGDVCFLTMMSLLPIGNIGLMLAALTGIAGRKHKGFFRKKVF
jgi:hypothetical protein